MKNSLIAAVMFTLAFGIGATTASALDFTSSTECSAGSAWDAKGAKCVQCKELVTDAGSLKSCQSCAAGTAFDITAAKCEKVIVKK
jgi:hypothetical protein